MVPGLSIPLLMLSSAQGATPAAAPPGEIPVSILEPARPKRGVVRRSGSCGTDTYETELRDAGNPGNGAALFVRVNGTPVSAREVGRVLALVPDRFFLHEARIAECDRGAPRARVNLLAGSPSTPKPLWISFLLSADGTVTGERLD